jgi:hypothetical protein
VATGVASANVDSKWYLFYVFPLGVGIANLVLVGASFRDRMASALTSSRRRERRERNASGGALKEIKETLSISGVWLLSLFFFFFLGASITAGGMTSPLIAGCLFAFAELARLDGRVPRQCPRWRRQTNGLCAGWLLWRCIPWTASFGRAHASVWRAADDLHLRCALLGIAVGILAVCIASLYIMTRCTDLKQCPEHHHRSSSSQLTRSLYGSILCNGLFFQFLHPLM